MTLLAVVLLLLSIGAGVFVMAMSEHPMLVEERTAVSVVLGVVFSALVALVLSDWLGFSLTTVFAAPLLVIGVACVFLILSGKEMETWRKEIGALRTRNRKDIFAAAVVVVLALCVANLIYSHALFVDNGSLKTWFEAAWGDWGLHSAAAHSFVDGANIPAQNMVYTGTPLYYPFLPDFHAATLATAGVGVATALELGSGIMAACILILVTALGRMLSGSRLVGAMAASICLLGGGLGFVGVFADACMLGNSNGGTVCNWEYLIQHANAIFGTVVNALGQVPHILVAQPRVYDGLLTDPSNQPLPGMEWFTPLSDFWVPQRTFVYGFATTVAIFCLLVLAMRSARKADRKVLFTVAGVAAGALPFINIHSLFVLGMVVPVFILISKWREWSYFVGAAILLAGPRVLQVMGAPKGSVALGNQFPSVIGGWEWAIKPYQEPFSIGNFAHAVGVFLDALITPLFWLFWMGNLGPVMVSMVLVALIFGLTKLIPWLPRLWHGKDADPRRYSPKFERLAKVQFFVWCGRVIDGFPPDLLKFCLAFLVPFVAANLIAFQPWPWDNTKILVYWYLAAALLFSGILVRWLRNHWGLKTLALFLYGVSVATGLLVVARFGPWTPTAFANGPFEWVTKADLAVAQTILAQTAPTSVFLTTGRPQDVATALAGRQELMGYNGWLWSYGIDYSQRAADISVMFNGCGVGGLAPPVTKSCQATQLMRAYHVDYAEFDRRSSGAGQFPSPWWDARFPVVARSEDVVVYDVRGA